MEAESRTPSVTELECERYRAAVRALIKSIKYIKRAANDRSERAWFRLESIADETDHVLEMMRDQGLGRDPFEVARMEAAGWGETR